MKSTFTIRSQVWLYPGMAGWHFVTVDEINSKEIKERYGKVRRGFGSIPVTVKVGVTSWKTSIFPNKDGTFVLPLKASIRKTESIFDGDIISFQLKPL